MAWRVTGLTQRLQLTHPLVLAPMAGVSTPKLVAAVTNSGGLGMYGAALTPAADLPAVVQAVRAELVDPRSPFGFNLFCPPPSIAQHTPAQQAALEEVHRVYAELAAQHGLQCDVQLLPPPDVDVLHAKFNAQVEALLDAGCPIIAFYFGLPDPTLLKKVQAAGIYTMGTATCEAEVLQLMAAGVDAIVVQGSEAGGHRGTWYTTPGPYTAAMTDTLSLVKQLAPLKAQHPHTSFIAAGGIMSGSHIAAALAAGADGVQLGTAFLAADEAGTSAAGKQLLLTEPDRGTLVTQAFTGKPARGLHNTPSKLLHQTQSQLPTSAYGLVNGRGFYRAAAEAGVKDCVLQLCGSGYPSIRTGSAADIVQQLLQETDAAVRQAGGTE